MFLCVSVILSNLLSDLVSLCVLGSLFALFGGFLASFGAPLVPSWPPWGVFWALLGGSRGPKTPPGGGIGLSFGSLGLSLGLLGLTLKACWKHLGASGPHFGVLGGAKDVIFQQYS